jgi:phosphatidyl-myo-inositol alpha-mannosyltransferase
MAESPANAHSGRIGAGRGHPDRGPRGEVLRIAIISNALPGSGRSVGGVAHFAEELATGLAERGHHVTGWTYDAGAEPRSYPVRLLPGSRFARTRLGRAVTEGYLGNLLTLLPRYPQADAIVAMGDSLLLPLLRKPLVRVMHGSALQEALSSRSVRRAVLQLGIYVQELLTALLQPGCVAVSANTLRSNPLVRRTIPNGIDLSTFSPDPAMKSPEPSILFVGTMEGRKRGDLLLRWFEEHVRPRFPNATLTVVGSRGRSSDRVTYRTGISKEDLAALYRSAWVFASPSAYEGFGLPYVEAMASGTPVIATPNPGSREVLDGGRFGILADDHEFADSLNSLLGSAEQRERLAALGVARAAEYSLDRMVHSYERLLLEMTGKIPGPGGAVG